MHTMRRLIALIIMLIVPLQFAWSAASGLHGHLGEDVAALGMHAHDHDHDYHNAGHDDHDLSMAGDTDSGHDKEHHSSHCHHVLSFILTDSSLALGATQWQTVYRVVLPAAIPGCITGGIIGIARALGETAPIILLGATFYITHLPSSPFDKYMALPYHTFILATQHSSPDAQAYAAGTAFVLILLTFILSFGAILLRSFFRRQKVW